MSSVIKRILPHREPMLMINEIASYENGRVHCTAPVCPDNPFLSEGQLPSFVGLELIAQASGISLGLAAQEENQQTKDFKAPASGAIVAVRDLKMTDVVLKQGMQLDVHAEFLGGSQQAAQFSGEVLLDGVLVCSTRVTIAMLEEEG